MQITSTLLLGSLFLGTVAPAQESQPEFGLEQLEALVAELEPFAPENPAYLYPLEIKFLEDAAVNAFAGWRREEDGRLQSTLTMCRGMVDAADGDVRLLRAVIAHELAHLVRGHAIETFDQRDFQHQVTRSQEHEADTLGAEMLVEAGYAEQDMVELLLLLDREQPKRQMLWLMTVGSDHASPVLRAALLDSERKETFRAISLLETGLAYQQCRRFEAAQDFFDAALEVEPGLHEAAMNAAQASLEQYYEHLPKSVQEEWLRPDFGPHLTEAALLSSRLVEVSDADRKRYARALERLDALPSGAYPRLALFLRGTAQVLHPDGDELAIRTGVTVLELLLSGDMALPELESGNSRLRYANNIALGRARLGDLRSAQAALLQAQAACENYVPSVAENVGRLPWDAVPTEHRNLAANVLVAYLQRTPLNAPGKDNAEASLAKLLEALGAEVTNPIEPPPAYLCSALTVRVGKDEVGLFKTVAHAERTLGVPDGRVAPIERFEDLQLVQWAGGDFHILAERGLIVQLTSYLPDSSIELAPSDPTLRSVVSIRVGMGVEELDALLSPPGTELTPMEAVVAVGRSSQEVWRHYTDLNMAAYVVDGKVAGIKVTPVK